MINKFQNSGIIKRAAHAINEHGNKPIYQDVRNFERSLENIR